jgi:hypothetical protein
MCIIGEKENLPSQLSIPIAINILDADEGKNIKIHFLMGTFCQEKYFFKASYNKL